MPDVREVFPGLEKPRRVKRGQRPQMAWTKAPSLDQVVPKLASTIVDSHVKTVNSAAGRRTEMRRYIFRNANRYGYLCIKAPMTTLDMCESYTDLQVVVNTLEQEIRWSNGAAHLVEYVAGHCTSPSYVNRIRQLQI